ncbi:hypothetical protein CALVIDRAFT_302716 [Calocera viscosa TUFC12733]|uniref:Low temperature requirement protein A n=1 Tax=Calocera viscosa (strain TUFC12733) TaxID=1330018 RepID=A0A167IE28_CALVF|nr:hypothetical protein CALVIDRAFT_302716 [Calocera viscosa TUFC12733]
MAPQHHYPLLTPGSEKTDPLERTRTESDPGDAHPPAHRPATLHRSSSTSALPAPSKHHAHHAEHLEGRGWQSRLLDWIVHLQKPEPNERHERVWLHDYQRAPEWLELFYDLVIVAVLSVFSETHEVSSGQSVAVYFSYFIIIWWVWASQTLYDVHFQANDWLHRLFKGAQLAAFAFIGACAAQFDPWNVTWTSEVSQEAAIVDAKANSFRGVAIAYAVGRALLVFQYAFVCVRLLIPIKNQNMREYKGHISLALFPAIVYGASGALWITAALLTNSEPAKLALAYSGIFIEFLSVLFQPLLPGYIKPPAEMISERFGALTLIILGEGIIGLIRSFSFVISGFGFTNTAYLQCFCALIIVFGAWHFMFHGFSAETFRLKRRSGALWLILHLPLHFSILLLFAGIRTATVYGNMVDAMTEVQGQLTPIIHAMQAGDLNLATVQSQNEWMTMQLGKLDMPTPWEQEVIQWQKAIGNHTVPEVDLTISSYGYIAEIWLAIADSFEVELSDTLVNETQAILNLNDTWVASAAGRIALENADYSMYTQFIDDFSIDIAQGVLFFFPAAVRTFPSISHFC